MTASNSIDPHLHRLKAIKALVLDVDGILTDGTTWLGDDGQWRRAFHIRDGLGLKAVMRAGYAVAFITGSKSVDIEARQKQLGIPFLYDGIEDKIKALGDFLAKSGLRAAEVAYMGDDTPDEPVLRAVGFAATVPEAMSGAVQAAHWVTSRTGGRGAVREVCDLLLAHGALRLPLAE